MARAYKPTDGLTSTYPYTEVNYHPASIGEMHGQPVESLGVVAFLNRHCGYKSVTEIPHNAGRKILSSRDLTKAASHSTSSKQHALNRAATCARHWNVQWGKNNFIRYLF